MGTTLFGVGGADGMGTTLFGVGGADGMGGTRCGVAGWRSFRLGCTLGWTPNYARG
jgi:hypothetical protein